MESSAFHRLHPRLQRWIWRTGWSELRDVQELAIPAILDQQLDVLIAAATAGGKTEAAFLPLLSHLVEDAGGSVRVLYVSPLRALINDQFRRLDPLCEELGVPVHRWHGDVGAAHKRRLRERPQGILIITPESLEALFVLRGHEIGRLFARLDRVVVDELHVFLGSERGAQLQSLLHRVELLVRRRVSRIGLSATLGDLDLACQFLRPGGGDAVRRIESKAPGQELRLQVRGYRVAAPPRGPREGTVEAAAGDAGEPADEGLQAIAGHLFDHLRGDHHLIFANARARVELLADILRRRCEAQQLPNEFWPHHGNLSKSLREEAEAAIRDPSRPASAVCTSTLELGIDVGAIKSVAQVGVPASVASLRQRLGRSGRAGDPAILRVYVLERALDERTPPHDSLRAELLQSIATLELLLAGWCEPPDLRGLHLSTLVQQLLSLIAQHGGARAGEAWSALCQSGPFARVSQQLFAQLLHSLGASRLIQQEAGGELGLGDEGERLVNHYTFYASFSAAEEYRVTAAGRALGSAPFSEALFPGRCVIFGGRRWVVASVDEQAKVVDLRPSSSGKPPAFLEGTGAHVHDRVRREMLRIYTSADLPRYLDAAARELLGEARGNFYRHRLHERSLVNDGGRTIWFPWTGDRVLDTLVVWAAAVGIEVTREGVALVFEAMDPQLVRAAMVRLLDQPAPDPVVLAAGVSNLEREKFHRWLRRDVLAADFASGVLDVEGAAAALRGLATAEESLEAPE